MRAYIEIYVDDSEWSRKEFEKFIRKWINKAENEGISADEKIPEQVDLRLIQIKED